MVNESTGSWVICKHALGWACHSPDVEKCSVTKEASKFWDQLGVAAWNVC